MAEAGENPGTARGALGGISPDRGAETSLRRIHGASLAIGLAAALVSLRFGSVAVTLGVMSGTALAMGVLGSWHLIVRKALGPKEGRKGLALLAGLLKLPVIAAVVYVLVGREWVTPEAFAAGFLVPQVAIVVLAIGRMAGRKPTAGVAGG